MKPDGIRHGTEPVEPRERREAASYLLARAAVPPGSKATATVIDASNDFWYDVSRPLPPEASYPIKVRSPRGPIKTRTGQYSLRNKLAQRALRKIGCSGRIRPRVLRY